MIGSENLHFVQALAPDADRWNGNPDSDVLNMAQYEGITFVCELGVGATGTVKFIVKAATNAAGDNSEAFAARYRVKASGDDTYGAVTTLAATGYTTVAGGGQIVLLEVLASDLPEGKNWVFVNTTEVVNDPCDAGILAVLHSPHHPQLTHKTVIA